VLDADASTERGTPALDEDTRRGPGDPAGGGPRPPELQVCERHHYTIAGELAQGGIGRVLLARDNRLGREVVVKELLASDRENEERFVREALITARLQHPSIVPIYEVGRWETGATYYAMKLVSGRSLYQCIAATDTLAQRLALVSHVLTVAEAIAYAHSRSIVHRDLKPGNVMIGEFGETIVIDWGLAKDLLGEAQAIRGGATERMVLTPLDPQLTRVGSVLGTPAYMAPEQAEGLPVDARADVYALGAILYHVLAGAPPYSARDSTDVLERVRAGPPTPLVAREPAIPADLLALVDKAMARGPDDRYARAGDFAEDLRRFLNGQLVLVHNYSLREHVRRFVRRYRRALVVVGVALAVLVVLAVLGLLRIVAAERSAVAERDAAEQQRDHAEAAQRETAAYADEVTLIEARGAAVRDPNAAVARLRRLSPGFERWSEARWIAADAQAHGLATVLRGHTDALNVITFAPDGRLLATASDDHSVRVWDPDGRAVQVLTGHTDEVWSARFSPAGDLLASCGEDGRVLVWTVSDWQRRELAGGGAPARRLRFVDDARLVTQGDAELRVWDLASGASEVLAAPPGRMTRLESSRDGQVAITVGPDLVVWDVPGAGRTVLPGPGDGFVGLTITADGRRVAARTVSGDVVLWDVPAGTHRVLVGHRGKVDALAFSPDGARLASGGHDRVVRQWQTIDGAPLASLEGHRGPMRGLLYAPDGRSLASASTDGTARLWDLQADESRVFSGFADAVRWLSFSGDGRILALAGAEPTARLYRVDAPRDRPIARAEAPRALVRVAGDRLAVLDGAGAVWRMTWPEGQVMRRTAPELRARALAVSPDGSRLAVVADDAAVWLLAADDGPAEPRSRPGAAICCVAFTPDGRELLSAGADGVVSAWPLAGEGSRPLMRHGGPVTLLARSDDGRHVAVAGADRRVRVHDRDTGVTRDIGAHADTVQALVFAPDGGLLASGGLDHALRLWRPATGDVRVFETSGAGVDQLIFTPDGRSLIANTGRIIIRVWDVETLEDRMVLRGHTERVRALALSPDGGRLLSASDDATLRLWDLATGVSRELAGHTGPVRAVTFTADGRAALSAGDDGAIRLWYDDIAHDADGLRRWIAAAEQ